MNDLFNLVYRATTSYINWFQVDNPSVDEVYQYMQQEPVGQMAAATYPQEEIYKAIEQSIYFANQNKFDEGTDYDMPPPMFMDIPESAGEQIPGWGDPQMRNYGSVYDDPQPTIGKIFNKNNKLKPSVDKFIKDKIFKVLKDNLGFDVQHYVQLYITGSLTTNQWSPTSDLDVSIFIDWDRWPTRPDPTVLKAALISILVDKMDGVYVPGTQHPLQIFVQPKEVQPQDVFKPGVRAAWDMQNKTWFVEPIEDSHNVQEELPAMYIRAYQIGEKLSTLLDTNPQAAIDLYKRLHAKRRRDTDRYGNWSEGNLIYKYLSHVGLFDRLRSIGVKIAHVHTTAWDVCPMGIEIGDPDEIIIDIPIPEEDPLTIPEEWPEAPTEEPEYEPEPEHEPEREKEPALTHVKKAMSIEKRPGMELFGWKILEVDKEGMLNSPSHAAVWPPGQWLKAPTFHPEQNLRSVAGIHSVAEGHWRELYSYMSSKHRVLVKVQLAGKIVTGRDESGNPKGYRSEAAKPVFVAGVDREILLKVANKYSIDTEYMGPEEEQITQPPEQIFWSYNGWTLVPSIWEQQAIPGIKYKHKDFEGEIGGRNRPPWGDKVYYFALYDPSGQLRATVGTDSETDLDIPQIFVDKIEANPNSEEGKILKRWFAQLHYNDEVHYSRDGYLNASRGWDYPYSDESEILWEHQEKRSIDDLDDINKLAKDILQYPGEFTEFTNHEDYSGGKWEEDDFNVDEWGIPLWYMVIQEYPPTHIELDINKWTQLFEDFLLNLAVNNLDGEEDFDANDVMEQVDSFYTVLSFLGADDEAQSDFRSGEFVFKRDINNLYAKLVNDVLQLEQVANPPQEETLFSPAPYQTGPGIQNPWVRFALEYFENLIDSGHRPSMYKQDPSQAWHNWEENPDKFTIPTINMPQALSANRWYQISPYRQDSEDTPMDNGAAVVADVLNRADAIIGQWYKTITMDEFREWTQKVVVPEILNGWNNLPINWQPYNSYVPALQYNNYEGDGYIEGGDIYPGQLGMGGSDTNQFYRNKDADFLWNNTDLIFEWFDFWKSRILLEQTRREKIDGVFLIDLLDEIKEAYSWSDFGAAQEYSKMALDYIRHFRINYQDLGIGLPNEYYRDKRYERIRNETLGPDFYTVDALERQFYEMYHGNVIETGPRVDKWYAYTLDLIQKLQRVDKGPGMETTSMNKEATLRWIRHGAGVYYSNDNRFYMYQVPDVRPPAWNIEWNNEWTYENLNSAQMKPQDYYYYSNLIVDGAPTWRDAKGLFDQWYGEQTIFPGLKEASRPDDDYSDEYRQSPDQGRTRGQYSKIIQKAKRLLDEGRVNVINNNWIKDPATGTLSNYVLGEVQGDHGDYECELWRDNPGDNTVTRWSCNCEWGQVSWGRTRWWEGLDGAKCAHLMALEWATQGGQYNPVMEPEPMPPTESKELNIPGAINTPEEDQLPQSPAITEAPANPAAQSQIIPPGASPFGMGGFSHVKHAAFKNGDYVRVRPNTQLMGEDRDGNMQIIGPNTTGEVLWSDNDDAIVIFRLPSSRQMEPHIVKVETSVDTLSLAPGNYRPFTSRMTPEETEMALQRLIELSYNGNVWKDPSFWDNIEAKTGLAPLQWILEMQEQGYLQQPHAKTANVSYDDNEVKYLIENELFELQPYMEKPEDLEEYRAWLQSQYQDIWVKGFKPLETKLNSFAKQHEMDIIVKPQIQKETLFNLAMGNGITPDYYIEILSNTGLNPGFSIWNTANGVEVEDVLEFNDPDFFSNEEQSTLYHQLVNYIRGGEQGIQGYITLYRGMFPEEYQEWEAGSLIPSGKFFTDRKTVNYSADIDGKFPDLYTFEISPSILTQVDHNEYQTIAPGQLIDNRIEPVKRESSFMKEASISFWVADSDGMPYSPAPVPEFDKWAWDNHNVYVDNSLGAFNDWSDEVWDLWRKYEDDSQNYDNASENISNVNAHAFFEWLGIQGDYAGEFDPSMLKTAIEQRLNEGMGDEGTEDKYWLEPGKAQQIEMGRRPGYFGDFSQRILRLCDLAIQINGSIVYG